MSKERKKIILAASYSPIEPLGLMHLSGVAKQEGWDPSIFYFREKGLGDLDALVQEIGPEILGITTYTGNHQDIYTYLGALKSRGEDRPRIVLGGPHATVFAQEAAEYADQVVVGEGFNSLRRILNDSTNEKILLPEVLEKFPHPDREPFYNKSKGHKNSSIKSVITQTGCPYSCTYCYNSSTVDENLAFLSEEARSKLKEVLGSRGRLFNRSTRSVDSVMREIEDIQRVSPETKVIYFQDDVFGENIEWLREFAERFPKDELSFHSQLRFEYADPDRAHGKERLELIRSAGGTGITLAIESGDEGIRKELLNRNMGEEIMFRSLKYMAQLGFKVRTEQMLGLPAGATSSKTPVGIESDLETLDLSIRLKQETGLPTFAWASTFVPYLGTKLGDYSKQHGFYNAEDNGDIPDNFFYRSVLRFPKEWVGPELSPENRNAWLSEPDQEKYRTQLQLLRDNFDELSEQPRGVELARKYVNDLGLTDNSALRLVHELSTKRRRHKYDELYGLK